jgi:hypothetical protein
MKTQPKIDTEEPATDFMLAEYATLRELRLSLDALGESRMNFFLATISGVIIGLGLLNQLPALSQTLVFINGVVFIGLFLLGLMTFARMVNRTIRITDYTRGMNRIRRYFVDKHPDIAPYLWLSVYDDRPTYSFRIYNLQTHKIGLVGLAPMVGVINCVIATMGIVMLTRSVFTLPIVWSVLCGAFTFFVLAIFHHRYTVTHMKQKRDNMDIRFPTPQKNH